jgi:hypothetical protein
VGSSMFSISTSPGTLLLSSPASSLSPGPLSESTCKSSNCRRGSSSGVSSGSSGTSGGGRTATRGASRDGRGGGVGG